MERSRICISPRRRAEFGALALALIVGCYATQALALSVRPPVLPKHEDYRACPRGQAWKDSGGARMQRARLRQPTAPPRDPALRDNVRRLRLIALHGGYDYQPGNAAVAAAEAAAVAAADAAATAADAAADAADAAADASAKPARQQASRPPEPRVTPAQARAAVQHLREILQRRPMPGVDEIGVDGVEALWLAIYRDRDDRAQQLRWAESFLETQRRVPGADGHLIRDAMEKVDDLLLIEGRPQRYGTQFDLVDGKIALRPIDSVQAAEAYRSEFERMPLALEICLRERLSTLRTHVPDL
ncbi:hypothetical protein [Lysobacter capsici]|uniref:hypothetical protein n=1 Tax=Lysobacter capsici TaxID=435897 RepID=UPI0012FDC7B2|nr:hypothetical protein [Lysobacter capsici]